MQMSFLRLWFSSVLVFFLLYDFDRSLCFHIRAVAQKQRQMFVKLKKVSFSENEFYHANEFSEVLPFQMF